MLQIEVSDIANCLKAAGDVSVLDRVRKEDSQSFVHTKIVVCKLNLLPFFHRELLISHMLIKFGHRVPLKVL